MYVELYRFRHEQWWDVWVRVPVDVWFKAHPYTNGGEEEIFNVVTGEWGE